MSNKEQIIRRIREIQKEEGDAVIIGIDGCCASGKTTIAKEIADEFTCNVIHIDDFYLPFSKRTTDQMERPGGNIDFERLSGEVLKPLIDGRSFEYCPYDCHADQYLEPKRIRAGECTIIEGSYSCHPAICQDYSLKIFLTIEKEIQRKRLQSRNPETMDDFYRLWIPRENLYFLKCHIRENSNLILNMK